MGQIGRTGKLCSGLFLQFRQWGKVEGAWKRTAGICARTSTNWWREAGVAMREDSEAPASLRSNLIGICSETNRPQIGTLIDTTSESPNAGEVKEYGKIANTRNHRDRDQSELIAHPDPVMPVLDRFPGLSIAVGTLQLSFWVAVLLDTAEPPCHRSVFVGTSARQAPSAQVILSLARA